MVISRTYFFGYGSLVNLATHDYENPQKAQVFGWRRRWVSSIDREVSFLSVEKTPESVIDGMVASVGPKGWMALDKREAEYGRHVLKQGDLVSEVSAPVQIYVARSECIDIGGHEKPILLSYIDCVIQGFLKHFGAEGVANFFASTVGWDRSIKNDRTAPIYPRAQKLTCHEIEVVDAHLRNLSVSFIS